MKDPMQISEHELAVMTGDLEQMHNDIFPSFTALLDELNERTRATMSRLGEVTKRDSSRRTFLAGGLVTAGTIGGGMVLSACGASTDSASSPTASIGAGDLLVAQLAASIEVLAINAYSAALKAAGSGALGTVPPAVSQFATTAKSQHTQHRDAWNAVLTAAGKPAQTDPDPKLKATVDTSLAAVRTIADVAKLALTLETIAAQTYVGTAAGIVDQATRQLALTIAPVEAQHVAILNFVIGVYPVPDGYIKLDQARTVSDIS